jgi:hypothetical protein
MNLSRDSIIVVPALLASDKTFQWRILHQSRQAPLYSLNSVAKDMPFKQSNVKALSVVEKLTQPS